MSMNQNLGEIIGRYRDSQGNVNYFALMADKSMVDYAETLSDFDLGTLKTREAQLAFWINSYNALSIYGVVKKLKKDPNFADRGNMSFLSRARFFAVQKFNVGGKMYSLKTIEDNIRKEFEDPRIHFALNCSSLGCPLLKDGFYSAENLDKDLDAATRLYLSSSEGVRLDKEEGILFISMIFKWYKKDFEATGKTVIEYIRGYAPNNIREFIDEKKNKLNLKNIQWDWSLNVSA
ncbi:MAG: DUF547 domain-containing protein [Candidatus Thorarchaeota archaeon]|nr:DUF547 domain-containing protein [Candidatus Thorarchaeota archaeon]